MDLLFEHNPPVDLPISPRIHTPLMGHQYKMVQAMEVLERGTVVTQPDTFRIHTSFGVVGDRVGSGKTLTVLAACASLPGPRICKQFIGSASDRGTETCPVVLEHVPNATGFVDVDTNLVIVPYHLEHQWIRELRTRTDLRWMTCTRTMFECEFDLRCWEDYDVVLCRSTIFPRLHFHLCRQMHAFRFRRVWIDEADSIRMANVPPVPAKFTWAMTGTPTRLCSAITTRVRNPNFVQALCLYVPWNMLHARHSQHAVLLQNDPDYVEACLNLPAPIEHVIRAEKPISLTVLEGILPERSLMCLAADDVAGALASFSNVEEDANVVAVVTRTLRQQLAYEEERLKLAERMNVPSFERDSAQRTIQRLRQQLECIRERIERAEDCPICYETMNTDRGASVVVECCQNVICMTCLAGVQSSTSQRCPFCKSALTKEKVVITHRGASYRPCTNERLPTKSEAFATLVRKLVSDASKRVLVFSETDGTWGTVGEILNATSIPYRTVKGSSDEVRRISDKFRNGDVPVLLLHASRMGAGLNLQSTTDVVLYHTPSSPSIREQIVGRANRAGRTAELHVHTLEYVS